MGPFTALVLVACSSFSEDGVLPVIFAKAALLPRRLHSVEYTMKGEAIREKKGPDGKKAPPKKSLYHFKYFGGVNGRFRAELQIKDVASGKTPIETVSLYNGDRHQFFDKNKEELVLSKSIVFPHSLFEKNPLVIPTYFFLFGKETNACWANVKSQKVWDAALQSARYLGEIREGDLTLVGIETPGTTPGTNNKVYFAKELDYLPVKGQIVPVGDTPFRADFRITEYRKLKAPGEDEPVFFPITIESRLDKPNETLTEHFHMIPESIKVNPKIPEDVFTFPHTQAKRVLDRDESQVLLNAGTRGSATSSDDFLPFSRKTQVQTKILLVLTACVVSAAILLWRRRRSRQRSVDPGQAESEGS